MILTYKLSVELPRRFLFYFIFSQDLLLAPNLHTGKSILFTLGCFQRLCKAESIIWRQRALVKWKLPPSLEVCSLDLQPFIPPQLLACPDHHHSRTPPKALQDQRSPFDLASVVFVWKRSPHRWWRCWTGDWWRLLRTCCSLLHFAHLGVDNAIVYLLQRHESATFHWFHQGLKQHWATLTGWDAAGWV